RIVYFQVTLRPLDRFEERVYISTNKKSRLNHFSPTLSHRVLRLIPKNPEILTKQAKKRGFLSIFQLRNPLEA
ncbi:MAG: hypothetical protein RRY23_06945, partial [Alistipes sp.]